MVTDRTFLLKQSHLKAVYVATNSMLCTSLFLIGILSKVEVLHLYTNHFPYISYCLNLFVELRYSTVVFNFIHASFHLHE